MMLKSPCIWNTLREEALYDTMVKKCRLELDLMNRNTIISMAMANAIWEKERKDLLALIRPFVLYVISLDTHHGSCIDISRVCSLMETEFGYKFFHPAVVKKVLEREIREGKKSGAKTITKKDNQYFLSGSLDTQVEPFARKRRECNSHIRQVVSALEAYLNQNTTNSKVNYSSEETERALLQFVNIQGASLLSSIDNLHQIPSKKNELEFLIAQFILSEYHSKSILADYINEIAKGYFATTAIFLQIENPDITKASFKNVTFYLDTRILLAYLGFKSEQENSNIQSTLQSLRRRGAKLACFVYNTEEVSNILAAYHNAIRNNNKSSSVTLEYFDSQSPEHAAILVQMARSNFDDRLQSGGITPIYMDAALESAGVSHKTDGLLDDEHLQDIVFRINPKYNEAALPDDLKAINTVSRIRKGRNYPVVEKSRAVFVTNNLTLVTATQKYLNEESINIGFPLAITADDLCVIAWIKDFEQSGNLPQMRLLENALAAVTPSPELIKSYLFWVNKFENDNSISEDEATLLRVTRYVERDLMELTHGNPENLSDETVSAIRDRIGAADYDAGLAQGLKKAEEQHELENISRRNNMCQKAESEVNEVYTKKQRFWLGATKATQVLLSITILIVTVFQIIAACMESSSWFLPILAAFASVISAIQTVSSLMNRDNWLNRWVTRWIEMRKRKAVDKQKALYLSILDDSFKS